MQKQENQQIENARNKKLILPLTENNEKEKIVNKDEDKLNAAILVSNKPRLETKKTSTVNNNSDNDENDEWEDAMDSTQNVLASGFIKQLNGLSELNVPTRPKTVIGNVAEDDDVFYSPDKVFFIRKNKFTKFYIDMRRKCLRILQTIYFLKENIF